MRNIILLFFVLLLVNPGYSQEAKSKPDEYYYNMFSCKDCYKKFFASTNSGIYNTPLGVRVGFFCQTGAYIGARFGHGVMYDFDPYNSEKTKETNLISVTTGLIKPIYIKNTFSLHAFIGAGYGNWWPEIREGWTTDGYEIEGGFMTSYQRFLLNISANVLNGYKTYATWDFTAGLGYRF
ncbi:MAG: hypothetical protein WCX31_12905 [Salinivirgaceae bacterium]